MPRTILIEDDIDIENNSLHKALANTVALIVLNTVALQLGTADINEDSLFSAGVANTLNHLDSQGFEIVSKRRTVKKVRGRKIVEELLPDQKW